MSGTYDVAQICLNGHVITTMANGASARRQKFCETCGQQTTTACAKCNATIRGYYSVPGVISIGGEYDLPRFCYECGDPYPWTSSKLQAAHNLADELDDLSDAERNTLKKSFDELVHDSPNTEVAAVRVKKILAKAGTAGIGMFKSILVDVLSEAAKKSLGM